MRDAIRAIEPEKWYRLTTIAAYLAMSSKTFRRRVKDCGLHVITIPAGPQGGRPEYRIQGGEVLRFIGMDAIAANRGQVPHSAGDGADAKKATRELADAVGEITRTGSSNNARHRRSAGKDSKRPSRVTPAAKA